MTVPLAHATRGALVIALTFVPACRAKTETPQAPAGDNSLLVAVAAASAPAPADAPSDLSPAARVALDSGNSLYRAKRYADALVQYRLTATRSPGDPTAYFGILMVAQATSNRSLADSATDALRAMGMTAPVGPHGVPKAVAK